MKDSILVVSAHSADFVWRTGGTLATYVERGWDVSLLVLSFGERGESNEMWKEPGQSVEAVKRRRRDEATAAAQILGVRTEFFDLGDYPLRVNDAAMDRIVTVMREAQPRYLLVHTKEDPYNFDHAVASRVALEARVYAQARGVLPELATILPPAVFAFEPHQPEMCGFRPTAFVDITGVFKKKGEAMRCMATQQHLVDYYSAVARRRGSQAVRNSGNQAIEYAEAFEAYYPVVGPGAPMTPPAIVRRIARPDPAVVQALGQYSVATLHEASGRRGLMDPGIRPIADGMRAIGPAVTSLNHAGDNLMLHAALEVCQRGDVLVVASMAGSEHGMLGELLAVQCLVRGLAGVVIDGFVRDIAELRRLGLPVWARGPYAAGTTKVTPGWVNVWLVCAGAAVSPGDVVMGDDDGVVVLPRGALDEVVLAAGERVRREDAVRRRYRNGELSLDVNDLRRALGPVVYMDE